MKPSARSWTKSKRKKGNEDVDLHSVDVDRSRVVACPARAAESDQEVDARKGALDLAGAFSTTVLKCATVIGPEQSSRGSRPRGGEPLRRQPILVLRRRDRAGEKNRGQCLRRERKTSCDRKLQLWRQSRGRIFTDQQRSVLCLGRFDGRRREQRLPGLFLQVDRCC